MLHGVQAFVLGLDAAHYRLQADRIGGGVGAVYPVRRAARHVVPRQRAAGIAFLAGAELFEVVGRGHAADIEKVFVLAYAARARFVRFSLGRDAVDGDFGLVDRDRPQQPDLRAELVHQVHVRIETQVARVLNHPVSRRFAAARCKLVAPREVGPVFGIGPLGPQQQMAMVERIEAAALLAPLAGVHRADLVDAGFALLALVGRGRIVPVHRRDMVAIGAVLCLQLPVALEGVGRCAAQHFQPVAGLVDDHIDDARRLTQKLGQRLDVRIQAAEQEAAVAFETRDFLEVVRAFLVEAVRVTGVFRVLHLEQLAAVVEGPAMEGAGVGRLVAALVAAECGATVAACIDECVQLALAVAGDHDRLAADMGRVVVIVIRDLAFVRQVDPVALEDVLHLEFKQCLVGKGAAMQAMVAGFVVFHQQVVDGPDGLALVRINRDDHDAPLSRYVRRWLRQRRGRARLQQLVHLPCRPAGGSRSRCWQRACRVRAGPVLRDR